MRAAIYARVSIGDDQNPLNQLIRLRSYASEQGWEVYAEYVDEASGANPNRPELRRMLRDAAARRFSVVIVVKLDRLARSLVDLETIIASLDRRGIKLEFLDQPVSGDTPEGVAFRQMLGVMAQLERGLISDRTKAGLARVRREGKRLGRPVKPVDMTRVHRLRESGMGYRRIAKELGVSHQTILNRLRKEGGDRPSESGTQRPGLGNVR